jgi:tRNA-dihydrouridine synthase
MGDGVGAHLMKHPELIHDMVKQARNATNLPVCVKIRVCPNDRDTVALAQTVERAGVAWLAVHGREYARVACGVAR